MKPNPRCGPHRNPRRNALPTIRATVRMHDEGKSYREIAIALNRSTPGVFQLIKRWGDWVRARPITIPAE
jgi:hypothetical protein